MQKHKVNENVDYHELAKSIVARRLETPAIFILEMFQPLSGLLHSSYEIMSPILMPIFGANRDIILKQLLSSPGEMEQLLVLIEEYSQNARS